MGVAIVTFTAKISSWFGPATTTSSLPASALKTSPVFLATQQFPNVKFFVWDVSQLVKDALARTEHNAKIKSVLLDKDGFDSHFAFEWIWAQTLSHHPSYTSNISEADLVIVPTCQTLWCAAELDQWPPTPNNECKHLTQSQLVETVSSSPEFLATHGYNFVWTNIWGGLSGTGISLSYHLYTPPSKENETPRESFAFDYHTYSRNIVVPYPELHEEFTELQSNDPLLHPDRDRPILAFIMMGQRRYALSVRDRIREALRTVPGTIVLGTDRGFGSNFTTSMLSSTFCPCPRGDTDDTRRLFTSVMAGCIPIIMADHLILPYEGYVDWDSAVFNIETSDLENFLQNVMPTIPARVIAQKRRALLNLRSRLQFPSKPSDLKPGDAVDTLLTVLASRASIWRNYAPWFRKQWEGGRFLLPKAKELWEKNESEGSGSPPQ
ncbi:hypothetical protein HDU93_003350 [Gonapodya sp. JEL0774]|nr:hypothetical protein HDU93_003350 [Gonapodya sp. JEL0774]